MPVVNVPSFPMNRSCPYHPPEGYADLRRQGPLAKVRLIGGRVVWAVTDHALARELLLDPRLSSDRLRPEFPIRISQPEGIRRREE